MATLEDGRECLEDISGMFVGTCDLAFRMVENMGRALTKSMLQVILGRNTIRIVESSLAFN